MPASTEGKYLIVNADDLGASIGINRGIFEACEHGIVTSASLMVGMPASEDAAARIPADAAMSIGLHATLTEEGGELKIDSRGCRAELERQLARFTEIVARAPTHLDSHHNIHRDRRLRAQFITFAKVHELPLREHSPARYVSSFYGQWGGETHLEQVSVASLLVMLESEVRPGITELGCHPGYVEPGFRSSYNLEREAELRTLCDPAVRDRLAGLDIRLINFADLPRVGGGAT